MRKSSRTAVRQGSDTSAFIDFYFPALFAEAVTPTGGPSALLASADTGGSSLAISAL
ncbi:MAG: hypothetical protein AAGH92_03325 [Planctomycetota bacterium]